MRLAFPELNVEINNRDVEIKLPWLKISAEIDPTMLPVLKDMLKHLPNITPDHPQFYWASRFLSHFDAYPIAFFLPNKCLLTKVAKPYRRETFLEDFLPKCGSWDLPSVLKLSQYQSSELCDPLSAYSAIRRLSLLEAHHISKTSSSFKTLEKLSLSKEELFHTKITSALRQIHFITSNCEESISPARASFPEGKDIVDDFLKDEFGHDRLIADSLKELGISDPNAIVVSETTVATMNVLKYSACYNPLGLCTILGHFEGINYSHVDSPLASLLDRSRWKGAARGLRKHLAINRISNHGNVGQELASRLSAVPVSMVEDALRLTEMFCKVKDSIFEETLAV